METAAQKARRLARNMTETCSGCAVCARACPFLEEHGTPGLTARAFLEGRLGAETGFHCSLCGLCTAMCPTSLEPRGLFLALRELAVEQGFSLAPARRLLFFERLGLSSALSCFGIPQGSSQVFLPGCVLPGIRPESVWRTFILLQRRHPDMGMVLACCAKPSRMLGRREFHEKAVSRLTGRLHRAGVRRVLTACPNCLDTLRQASPGLKVEPVYSEVARCLESSDGEALAARPSGEVTVHDPCPLRFEPETLEAVRRIAALRGCTVREHGDCGSRTLCCGEGGGVGFFREDLSRQWQAMRRKKAPDAPVLTSCGGCLTHIDSAHGATHVLDILGHHPPTALPRPPATYFNRIRLKLRVQRWLSSR